MKLSALAVILFGFSLVSSSTSETVRQETADRQALPASGSVVKVELTAARPHAYSIAMDAEQLLRLKAEQISIDLMMTLFAPDGRKVAETDFASNLNEFEMLSYISSVKGVYRLEISSRGSNNNPGLYQLTLDPLRTATPNDVMRLQADAVYLAGEKLRRQGTAQSLRQALQKYSEALPLYRAASDRNGEAETLNTTGATHVALSEYRQALEFYRQAVVLFRSDNNRKAEASALANIGVANTYLGDYAEARRSFELSLPLRKETGNINGEASDISNLATLHGHLAEYSKAVELFEQALVLFRRQHNRAREGSTLASIATIYEAQGRRQDAIRACNQALEIARATKDRRLEGRVLTSLAQLHTQLGDYGKALDLLNESLPLRRDAGDVRGEAYTVNSLAITYSRSGDLLKSLQLSEQGAALCRKVGDKRGEAAAIIHMGWCYTSLGEMEKALETYRRSLPLVQELGDRYMQALALTHMGNVSRLLNDFEKSALDLVQATEQARAIKDPRVEALALYNLAMLERQRGNLQAARRHSAAALGSIERQRGEVSAHELRASFVSSMRDYYELDIDLLVRLHEQHPASGFAALALQASESTRARSLLDLLAEMQADIRQGVNATLLEQENRLSRQLSAKAEQQTRLLSGTFNRSQAELIARDLVKLAGEYENVQGEIRAQSPAFAALKYPEILNIQKIQGELLDRDTALLEYATGKERSYLWIVTDDSLSVHILPGRAKLVTAVRAFYELLRKPEQSAALHEAAFDVSRTLMPAAARGLEKKRLVIVADDALQYVPFGALSSSNSQSNYKPLVLSHEIISLPSASSLALLRAMTSRTPAPKSLAVLADPVFEPDDPRIRAGSQPRLNAETARADAGRASGRDSTTELPAEMRAFSEEAGGGPTHFARLIGSRREAQAILSLVPPGQKQSSLDFAASRETATAEEMRQYRIIHFASHALLNNSHPSLSGIVLSLRDPNGNPRNGFLRLHEIFNLRLPADLVVLSACQTALGKEVRGEGLVGLTRGFMYAGARRVIASLWKVDDRATAELMKYFYQAMLGPQRMQPAAALRLAQMELQKSARWRSPYYWAGFILQGDWR